MQDEIKKLFSKRLYELRTAKGLTQEALGEKAGIETSTVSNIETSKNYPSSETLKKLSDALEVKPYEMYLFDHLTQPTAQEMRQVIKDAMADDDELTRNLYLILRTLRP